MSKVLTLLCLLAGLSSCKTDGAATEGTVTTLPAGATSAEFEAFYELFHTDSVFQVEHIVWPLDGNLQADGNGGSVDVQWQPDTWIMHKPLELGHEYIREIAESSEDLVVERVKTTEGSYIIERRFAKFGDMWMLIYYRVADVG